MKQNIIQSIIRRGLSFVLLSLLMPLGVGAQEYALWIGDTQVTSDNAGDVLGDGKVTFSVGGDVAVVYTLTLNGAELTEPVKVGLSKITYAVTDTGMGVPANEAERIFEPFVKLNSYFDGQGLGLTFARSIARRLGGELVLDTANTAKGARFVMTLPM